MHNPQTIIGSTVLVAISLYFGWIAWGAWRSGVAETAGGRNYKRKRNPAMYWTATIVLSLFFLLFLLSAALQLTGIIHSK